MIHAIQDVKIKISAMKQKSMDIEQAIQKGKTVEEIQFMIEELQQLAREVSIVRMVR